MDLLDITWIGIGLSMDAAAISMSNGMVYRSNMKKKVLWMPIFFGAFQAGMPILGFFTGGIFQEFMAHYSGIAVLFILGIIGGKMIWDGLHPCQEAANGQELTYKLLFMQAIATSIDAFAVGIGFSAVGISILPASTLIGVTTFCISFFAIFIGKKFGDIFENKAELLGGVILVAIGIKSFLGV